MKRRLFNILSALSLLLCTAATAMWVRSYWRLDRRTLDAWNYSMFEFASWRGDLGFCYISNGEYYPGLLIHYWLSHGNLTIVSPTIPNDGLYSPVPSYPTPEDTHDHWHMAGFALETEWFYLKNPQTKRNEIKALDCALVIVPAWFVCLLTGLLPAWWCYRRLRSRKRKRLGLCSTCSYDLRASKERCPECGSPIPSKPQP